MCSPERGVLRSACGDNGGARVNVHEQGAAELHRRLSDLGDTQDLLAAAMNAVSNLSSAGPA